MSTIRVAYLTTIIPHYRDAFIKQLSQMGLDRGIVFESYHGQHSPNGPGSVGLSQNYPNTYLRNTWLTVMRKELVFQVGLIKELRHLKPDVVVATHETHNLSILLAWFLRKPLGFKWVWWGHGSNYQKTNSKGTVESLNAMLKDQMLRKADGVITYTSRGTEYCKGIGIPVDKVFAYMNTIDVKAVQDTAQKVSDDRLGSVKSLLGLKEKRVLLFSGRLYKFKRVDFLLRSLKKVQTSLRDVALIILGDGPERARLEVLAKELGLHDVHFVGEVTDHSRSAPFFILSELLVIPGIVGLAIVHGFAMGLPLVTTRQDFHGPEVDYLSDKCGVMSSPTEEAYSEAILDLLRSEGQLRDMRLDALKVSQTLYLEKSVDRFLEALKTFTSKP